VYFNISLQIRHLHKEVTVKFEKTLTSAVATLMVMNMLILTAAILPVQGREAQQVQVQGAHSGPQQAGFFGCLWSCMKCVGSIGTHGKSCRKCAHCLGDDTPEEPATGS